MSEVKLQATKDMSDAEKFAVAQAMLQGSLSDIADLAEFVTLPKGTHSALIDSCDVDVNQTEMKVTIKIVGTAIRPVTLAQYPGLTVDEFPAEAMYPENSKFSFNFFGSMGMQEFKRVVRPLTVDTPDMPMMDVINGLGSGQYGEVILTIGSRMEKEPNGVADDGTPFRRTFAVLQSIQPV